jgi:septal ring factor EnvC (AmiA/AmiB activator)
VLKRFFLVSSLVLVSGSVFAAGDSAQRLDNVRDEIQDLNADLSATKADRKALYDKLKAQSLKISGLNRDLRELQKKIDNKAATLKQLRDVAGIKEAEQQKQLDALYDQMRAAFINADPSYLEMLLNQQDIAAISRGSTYFRYFHEARKAQLDSISEVLAQLNQEQKDLLLAQQALETDKARQLETQQKLQQEADKRKTTLAALDKTISGKDARLSALKQEEHNLQALLDKLAKQREQKRAQEQEKARQQQQTATAPIKNLPPPKPNTPFSRLTGKLNWPVHGKLLASYGSPRNLGKLRWQGIVIDSATGNDVKATAAGTVVFADWLRGFGLLVIIDHGEQYMTLYGNNESLLKQAGDHVQAGETIAESGEQGIRGLTGLYFEIRHRGTPTNPMKWLAGRG